MSGFLNFVDTKNNLLFFSNSRITVRASTEITDGGMLFTTYTNVLHGTAKRQAHLKNSKFFTCRCERCIDPTELETHFSSLKCNECNVGFVHSSDPFGKKSVTVRHEIKLMNSSTADRKCEWICTQCDCKTKVDSIRQTLSIIQTEVDNAQSIDFGPKRLERCELLIRKYRKLLHPLHYIQTGLSQNLIELYGRVDGYELQKLTDILLEHKIDLCLQVLTVLDAIHPGKTRSRAMLLYELHAPLVFRARNAYTAGFLKDDALKTKLQESINLLKESTEILEWEDVTTTEYAIAQIGKKALVRLKENVDSVST